MSRQQGTTTIIELSGEWDMAGAPAARDAFAAVLDSRPECVVLDLTDLSFIDSSGLHATFELAGRADREGIRLAILVGSRMVRRTFEISGLSARLPLLTHEPDEAPDHGLPRLKRASSNGTRDPRD